MERKDGDHIEPWTWTNEYKDGRMFYTAYGHDERTWSNPGFHDLMKRGILWAVGDKAAGKADKLSFPQPKYTEAKIPNYEKRDPPLKLQQGLSPEESMQLTQVPIGFELELFAAEPDIINPIAMAWDERGRLWVIETVDYPNTVRSDDGVGDDRVKICEDTNGDRFSHGEGIVPFGPRVQLLKCGCQEECRAVSKFLKGSLYLVGRVIDRLNLSRLSSPILNLKRFADRESR